MRSSARLLSLVPGQPESMANKVKRRLTGHGCPFRVKSGPDDPETGFPKYPRKQTSKVLDGRSAWRPKSHQAALNRSRHWPGEAVTVAHPPSISPPAHQIELGKVSHGKYIYAECFQSICAALDQRLGVLNAWCIQTRKKSRFGRPPRASYQKFVGPAERTPRGSIERFDAT